MLENEAHAKNIKLSRQWLEPHYDPLLVYQQWGVVMGFFNKGNSN